MREYVVGVRCDVHEIMQRGLELHAIDLWLERRFQSLKLVCQRDHVESVAPRWAPVTWIARES